MNAIPNMNISDITNKVLSSTPNAGEDIAKKISTDTSTADNSTSTAPATSIDNKATATPVSLKIKDRSGKTSTLDDTNTPEEWGNALNIYNKSSGKKPGKGEYYVQKEGIIAARDQSDILAKAYDYGYIDADKFSDTIDELWANSEDATNKKNELAKERGYKDWNDWKANKKSIAPDAPDASDTRKKPIMSYKDKNGKSVDLYTSSTDDELANAINSTNPSVAFFGFVQGSSTTRTITTIKDLTGSNDVMYGAFIDRLSSLFNKGKISAQKYQDYIFNLYPFDIQGILDYEASKYGHKSWKEWIDSNKVRVVDGYTPSAAERAKDAENFGKNTIATSAPAAVKAAAKDTAAPAKTTPAATTTPTPDTGKFDDDATKDDGNTKKKEYKDNHFMTAAEQERSDNVIAEADKVINDLNASEADKNEAYTNKIIENARQATAKTKSDEVEQDTNTAKDYAKGVGQVVDPEYAKNLPKTIIEAYNNGDFGTVGSDDAMDTLGYFILNTIGTGLTNSTQYFPGAYGGKGTQQTPAYQGMLSKELENAIQRKNDTINKKNDDARELVNKGAISQTSLNSAQNKWAQDQQQNVYAKTLEGYQQVAAALGDEVLGEYIQGLDKDKAATLSLGNLLLNGGDAQKGAALFIQALGPENAKEALGKISKAVSDNTAFTSKEKTILDAQNSQALAKVTADAGADAAIKTAKGTLDTELAKMSATAQFEINKQIAIMQEKYALEKDLEKAKAGIQKELMQMQHKYNMTEDALKAAETMVVSVVGTGAKAAAMASDKHAKLYYRIGGWRK